MSYVVLRDGLKGLLVKYESEEWISETVEEIGHPLIAMATIASLKHVTQRVLGAARWAHLSALGLAGLIGLAGVVFNGLVVVHALGLFWGILFALLLAVVIHGTYVMAFALLMLPVMKWLGKVAPPSGARSGLIH